MQFTCPSYHLVETFASAGLQAYKYQHSRTAAHHAADLFMLGFLPPPPEMHITLDLSMELQGTSSDIWHRWNLELNQTVVWGNFVVGKELPWKAYTSQSPDMYNFNTSGGELSQYTISNYTAIINSGEVTSSSVVVDARDWEGDRGTRCDFWKKVRSRPYLNQPLGSGW